MVFIYIVHIHRNQGKTCPNATLFCTNLTHLIAVIQDSMEWQRLWTNRCQQIWTWPHYLIISYILCGRYTVLRVKHFSILVMGTAVAQWLRCCATNWKVAGSIPASVCGFFFDIKSFRSHYSPGVDSSSNRNEYQEYFLGVKAASA